MRQPTHICRSCMSTISPIKITPGSFLVEIVLFLLFILPGLLYSAWRISNRYAACPVCRSREIIPLHSPAAQSLLQRNAPTG